MTHQRLVALSLSPSALSARACCRFPSLPQAPVLIVSLQLWRLSARSELFSRSAPSFSDSPPPFSKRIRFLSLSATPPLTPPPSSPQVKLSVSSFLVCRAEANTRTHTHTHKHKHTHKLEDYFSVAVGSVLPPTRLPPSEFQQPLRLAAVLNAVQNSPVVVSIAEHRPLLGPSPVIPEGRVHT